MRKIRVLIVDDHLVLAQALEMALSLQPDLEVVGVVADGLKASQEAARRLPDVVLMDYGLPGVNGAIATQAIKELLPQAKVVMLTSYAEPGVLLESLKAGVSGFLSKDKAMDDVMEAVRLAAAGEMQVPPATLRGLLARLDKEESSEQGLPSHSCLTARELEVLQWLATGAEREAIARQLGISPHTVRTHTERILAKLGVHSKLEAVSLAIRRRLIHPPS